MTSLHFDHIYLLFLFCILSFLAWFKVTRYVHWRENRPGRRCEAGQHRVPTTVPSPRTNLSYELEPVHRGVCQRLSRFWFRWVPPYTHRGMLWFIQVLSYLLPGQVGMGSSSDVLSSFLSWHWASSFAAFICGRSCSQYFVIPSGPCYLPILTVTG